MNPNRKAVIKKGVETPRSWDNIPNVKWVSPIQVIHKKGRMNVIKNDKDGSVVTRTVRGERCVSIKKIKQSHNERSLLTPVYWLEKSPFIQVIKRMLTSIVLMGHFPT